MTDPSIESLRSSAVRIANPMGRAPFILVCEHASNAPPPGSDPALWPSDILGGHQAYDLGAAELTEAMAARLDAPAVLAGITRLYYDINRAPADIDCAPAIVDGVSIPANADLNALARAWRFEVVAAPFHLAIDELAKACGRVSIVSIHSCAPQIGGFKRPWEIGVIYGLRNSLVNHLLAGFSADRSLTVGDNQPYSGFEVEGYTLWRHAAGTTRLAAALEFRHDQLMGLRSRANWCLRACDILESFERPNAIRREALP
jgi:predicted N-formylglutamate amidohydrolase